MLVSKSVWMKNIRKRYKSYLSEMLSVFPPILGSIAQPFWHPDQIQIVHKSLNPRADQVVFLMTDQGTSTDVFRTIELPMVKAVYTFQCYFTLFLSLYECPKIHTEYILSYLNNHKSDCRKLCKQILQYYSVYKY